MYQLLRVGLSFLNPIYQRLQICLASFYKQLDFVKNNKHYYKIHCHKWHIQRVYSHAGPLLHHDGAVGGSWGVLLVGVGDPDAHRQTSGENAIVPRVHRDDDGKCDAHGLTLKNEMWI